LKIPISNSLNEIRTY